jgi:hypothetical protein
MSRKFLYRRSGLAVIVILGVLFALAPPAAVSQGSPQLKRPQETTPEKVPEETKLKKKIKGPRAVGVLQLTKSGKATLIPVAILVDGKFYDASAYKADPIPMALEGGTVYEAEQAGDSLGLFTVNGALHSKAQGAPHPWIGAGSFLPKGTEAPKSTRKAEDVPVGMDSTGKSGGSSSDDRPRLKRGSAETPAPTPAPASSPSSNPAPSGTPAGTGTSSAPSEKSGTAAPPATSQPASASSGGGPSGQDAAKPAASPASEKSASSAQESKAAATQDNASRGQASDNNYRPTLRRGKPTESAPQEYDAALADKSNAGKPASSSLGKAAAVPSEPVQLVAAISDGGGPDPRPYQFYWKPGEEDERRQQMLTLAGNEVQAYANALAKNRIPATPPPASSTTAKSRKTTAKPVQPVLENIQFRTFDVWTTSQPVMILSGEAHFPPAPGATTAPEQYSITLVARTDIYGSLRKLYAGVTDKFHLDVTPRLELIDAVDADGDGRGELLFRETTDAGSGYVIYRASADKLSKMFDSLSE